MSDRSGSCDVLVIGGGPAGSAISTLLAESGWSVELLEKTPSPRFHIGESLLPHTVPILNRLGVLPEVEKIGIRKYGVDVISPTHENPHTLYFSKAMDPSFPYAFQVRRSEFDHILLRNARGKGVKVHEGLTVNTVSPPHHPISHVTATDAQGTNRQWHPRFVVDATGRDALLATQWGVKERNPHHKTAAIFGHFEGVHRHEGIDEGNISIFWFEQGWIWMIPFKDGITSVGAVCRPAYLKSRKTGLDQFLWATIGLCPPAAERFKNANPVAPALATGNYSYRSTIMAGPNYLLVGDAFAFIDPIFSTGVHLALTGAIKGADVIHAYLQGRRDYFELKKNFERTVRRNLDRYSWFIYRFMQPAFRNLFMAPRNWFRMEEAILSILAGDLDRRTSTEIPVFFFKGFYYVAVLFNPLVNWAAFGRRLQASK